jgi:histone H3/H4
MEAIEEQRPAMEQKTVASPRESSFEVPERKLQQEFEEQNREKDQDTSSAAQAPFTGDALEPAADNVGQQDSGEAMAQEAAPTGSSRGGAAAAGRGKGRGGARVTSTASAKGSRGGKAAGGASARGSSKAASRGGAKAGRGGAAKGGKGLSAKASKASLVGGAEASGSGSAEGAGNTIGSGPSNTVFPLARVSRIVKVDKEIEMTSKDAIWTIAVATELFIKHLTDSAYAKARLDKKKTVTFKELASAVESQNEFFFLQGESQPRGPERHLTLIWSS